MGQYAKGTTVTVAKSRAEIEEQIERFGATGVMFGRQGLESRIMFEARDRRVMFRMTSPSLEEMRLTETGKRRTNVQAQAACDAENRRRWRSLAMSIKAKLVSVQDGIETFEQAFMAHVVMPDGLTLSDHVSDRIAIAYESGEMPPLLPAPKDSGG